MKKLEQRLDHLIGCNTKLIEFLAQKDRSICTMHDDLRDLDKVKALLDEDLIGKKERIIFLENVIKDLKREKEVLTLEKESLKATLEVSIQVLEQDLKQFSL